MKPPFAITPGQKRYADQQHQLKPRGRTLALPAGDRKGPGEGGFPPGHTLSTPPHCYSSWGYFCLILLPALLPIWGSITPSELHKGGDFIHLAPAAHTGPST